MTNEQKYKTPEERNDAFDSWRKTIKCEGCSQMCDTCEAGPLADECGFKWLALEAEEEKPEPCPFCGGKHIFVNINGNNFWYVSCKSCLYKSLHNSSKDAAISAHNRVCRAVEAVKKGDVK